MAAPSNVMKIFRLHKILVSFQKTRLGPLVISQRWDSSNTTNVDPTASNNAKPTEPVKGKICQKQPLKILLEAGKNYVFCTCGYSKHQPFCDSSHKGPNFADSRPHHSRYQPMPFTVTETKEYWLCLCKQSNKRPFCDSTHKRTDIQAATPPLSIT